MVDMFEDRHSSSDNQISKPKLIQEVKSKEKQMPLIPRHVSRIITSDISQTRSGRMQMAKTECHSDYLADYQDPGSGHLSLEDLVHQRQRK